MPSLEEIKGEVQNVFNEIPHLWNLAEALGMAENKIQLVFDVKGATPEAHLDTIVKWWLNRRRTERTWRTLVEAIEKIPGEAKLAEHIKKKYITVCADQISLRVNVSTNILQSLLFQ